MKSIYCIFMIFFTLCSSAQDNEKGLEYIRKGDAFLDSKDFESAILAYNSALENITDKAYALNKRGIAYMFSNQYDNAIKDFTTVIDNNPEDPNGYFARGMAKMLSGSTYEIHACTDIRKAQQLGHNIESEIFEMYCGSQRR